MELPAELPTELPPTTPRAKSKGPVLREATFDDYDRIAELQGAHGLSVKAREEWLHLWQSNPAYVPGWPIGWVLEEANGRIAGALENVPCLYRMGGRSYVAAFGRGWAADLQYRAFAMMLIIRQLQQPGVDLRLTSTASPRTSELLLQRDWSPVPAGEWDRSAFWVTNYARAAREYLAARVPRPLAAAGSVALSPAFFVKDVAAKRAHRIGPERGLSWVDEFDERFEGFWAELESRNPQLLLAVRDRETLGWHFRYSLEQGRLWILTASEGSRLTAYAIFQRREIQSLGLARMMLVDYRALDDDQSLAAAMLSCAWQRCRSEGIDVLENSGCWLEKKLIERAPHRRVFGSWCFLYQAVNPDLRVGLSSPEAWDPTQYDADASL